MNSMNENSNHVKFFDEHMENFDQENSALHRKLQSKIEALKILRRELEQYRTERDQFKLMAETLQMRYTSLKKSLQNDFDPNIDRSKVGALLNETREQNIALNTEVENLRQKLSEMQGDIEALRNQNHTQIKKLPHHECNEIEEKKTEWNEERSKLISNLEIIKKKNAQLQYDFRALLDEKEEIVTERDAYKCKVHRLNHELNIALKGEEAQTKVLDIDALVLENKYLQERLKNMENELEMAQQSITKYKSMLDTKRKKGIIKLGTNSDMIMSHKQVKNLLERGTLSELPLNAATISDLKSLCLTLLDNLNDKNLAYVHQKKANKILAERITELENRLQSIVLSGEQKNTNSSIISPSQLLLKGYTSSTVDQQDYVNSSRMEEDSGTASSEGSKTNSRELEQLSNDSNKSVASSEFEGTYVDSEASSEYTIGNDGINDELKNIELQELPPDLAALVEKALKESSISDD